MKNHFTKANFISPFGLLFFCFFLLNNKVNAQLDTEFWFAPPELTQSTGEPAPRDRPIQMVLSTLEKPATIKILQPADLTFEPIILSLPANSTQIVNLTPFINRLESKPHNTVLKTGLLIQATNSISAYYEIKSTNNTDIFTLKGANANGKLFFTPFQTHWDNALGLGGTAYDPTTYASFDIIATDDSTFVTVTPKKEIIGHEAGVPFTFMLNRGEVYSCRAIDRFGANRPAGSKIESTKDIAVTVKDDMLQFAPPAAGADIAGDQIMPVDFTGTEYVLVRGGLSGNNDRVYITATEDNTVVRVNGVATPVATLNIGEQYELQMADPTYYVKATKKVYAWHISGIADQVGGAMIPSLSCTGTNQIGFARTNNATFVVNVITKESAKNSFTLNGDPTLVPGSAFQPIQGSNGWVYARITFTTAQIPQGTTCLLKNPSNELFNVGVSNYAVGVGSNYGYFSNFSRLNLGSTKQLCIGDTAILDAGPAKTSYIWNTGATTRYIETLVPGKYWVNTLSGSQCPKTDTVLVRFYTPTFNIGPDDTLCIGETKLIEPAGVFTFFWQDSSTSHTYLATQPGIYWAQVADFQGCTTRDSLQIFEAPRPETPIASGSDTVCRGTSVNLAMSAIPNAQYEWLNPLNQIITGKNISINTANQPAGIYQAFVKIGSCLSLPDSIMLGIENNPMVNLGRDSVFCGTTGSIVLDPGEHLAGQTYLWNTGTSDTLLTVTESGTYHVRIENVLGCTSTDTIQVTFQGPTQTTIFSGNDDWCQGQQAIFGVEQSAGYVYQWVGPNGFSFAGNSIAFNNILSNQSGNYEVTPYLNGCAGPSSSRTISVASSPQITLGEDISGCQIVTFILDPIPHGDGFTYLWSNNSTDSNLVVNGSGTYWVAVTNGTCTSRDTLVVTYGLGPNLVTFTGQNTFCQNNPADFGVVQQLDETYSWTGPNGFTFSGNQVSVSNIQPNQSGIYTVIPSKDGCDGQPFTRTITVLPAPGAFLGLDTSFCPGGTLILDPSPNGGEETFYIWNTGSADSILVVSQPGTYHVEVTDGFCSSFDTIAVSLGSAPQNVVISGLSGYCEGATLTLSVPEELDVNYSWVGPSGFSSAGASISVSNIGLSQAGDFIVTSLKAGCEGTPDTITVEVFPVPNVNLGQDLLVCTGSTTTLNPGVIGTGLTYLWSNGTTDTVLVVAAPGDYFVTVSSEAGLCSASDTIQVTFGTPPTSVVFQGFTDYCSGSTTAFGVTPETGITYNWTGPNGFTFSGSTIEITNIQPNQAGSYFVVPTLGSCAGDTAHVDITISQGPEVGLGVDVEQCGFAPITLDPTNGQSGFTYLWNGGTTDSTLMVNQTGQYFVTVSYLGCSKSDTVDLTFKPLPLPVTIEGDVNHCAGTNLVLTLQGNQSGVLYNWSGPNGFTSEGISISISAISLIQSGQYKVKPMLDGCEGPETFIDIVVNPSPVANLGLDIESCLGTSFTLDPVPSSSGLTFMWINGSTDTSLIINQSGLYSVTVTNAFNCSASDTIQATFTPVPIDLQFSGDSLYCSGQNASFGVTATGNLNALWTGPNGFTFNGLSVSIPNLTPAQSGYYVIIPRIGSCFGSPDSIQIQIKDKPNVNLGPDESLCGDTAQLLSVENPLNHSVLWSNSATTNSIFVSTSGTYSVTVSTGACSASDTIQLTFNSIPMKPVLSSESISICDGATATLSVTPEDQVVYTWAGPNDFTANGLSIVLTGTASNQGTFTVFGEKSGCMGPASTADLTIKPNPTLVISAPEIVCKGKLATASAAFTAGASVLWSDLSNQPTAQFGPGRYWAKVTLNGCLASDSFAIQNSGPKADFKIGPDSQAIVYQKVQFIDMSLSGLKPINSWEWKLGYSQIQTTQNAEFTYLFQGAVAIQLIVKDADGCMDTTHRTININPLAGWTIPTVFTPNADGSNDTFEIIDLEKYPESSLTIFDRWGKELLSRSNYDNSWTGDDLTEGIYFYTVKRSDGQSFNGYILLKR